MTTYIINLYTTKRDYSCSQLPAAMGVFRRFLTQFLNNLNEILQALFATIPTLTLKIA